MDDVPIPPFPLSQQLKNKWQRGPSGTGIPHVPNKVLSPTIRGLSCHSDLIV